MQAWGQSRRPDGLRDVSASPRLPTNWCNASGPGCSPAPMRRLN